MKRLQKIAIYFCLFLDRECLLFYQQCDARDVEIHWTLHHRKRCQFQVPSSKYTSKFFIRCLGCLNVEKKKKKKESITLNAFRSAGQRALHTGRFAQCRHRLEDTCDKGGSQFCS